MLKVSTAIFLQKNIINHIILVKNINFFNAFNVSIVAAASKSSVRPWEPRQADEIPMDEDAVPQRLSRETIRPQFRNKSLKKISEFFYE